MDHRYQLTRLSANKKLGGLPASMQSQSTCPDRCSFKGNGCYAEAGNVGIHFRAISRGDRGVGIDEFCEQVRLLPKHSLWRYGVGGDLPGDGVLIDAEALKKLVSANRGRHAFSYSHYDPRIPHNAELIRYANESGFVINLSAETLEEADEFSALRIGPVVTVLPIDQTENSTTRKGRAVQVCPASISNTTCALCGVCAVANRKSVIGFPAHGSGKARVQRVFLMKEAEETEIA